MKGIILAAGNGTRMFPASEHISKVLLPVYDKPMVYYPLSTLLNAEITEIMIIVSENDLNRFERLLGDGSQFGISIVYAIQYVQRGIADAFIIAEDFIGSDDVCLVLGDNIFYHERLPEMLKEARSGNIGATIFGCPVKDPERFGVIEFDDRWNVISIEEKPLEPKSRYAAAGLYFYTNDVCEMAKELEPSARGELEITDLNLRYLEKGLLKAVRFEGGMWADTGTFDSLLDAGLLIRSTQNGLGEIICCPELIALSRGLVSAENLREWAGPKRPNEYYEYVFCKCDR